MLALQIDVLLRGRVHCKASASLSRAKRVGLGRRVLARAIRESRGPLMQSAEQNERI